jgi:uncharacterized protein YccT (UPF0319 family)
MKAVTWMALLVSAMMWLTGCASTGPIRLYEGPARQQADVTHIQVPEQVQVMAMDGVEVTGALLQRGQALEVLPGEHVLTLRYVQLFQINSNDHEVVRSRQAALRFTAEAGETYRLEMDVQSSLDAARKFAKSPAFRVVNVKSGAMEQSVAIKSYAEASLVDTITKAFESTQQQAQGQTHLDLLKDVWTRAVPEERTAFKKWLEQQP